MSNNKPLNPMVGLIGSLLEASLSQDHIVTGAEAEKELTSAGIKHDSDKVPLDLLSPIALTEIAKVMSFGRSKYSAHNWRKGIAWCRVIGAALRHILSFLGGEDKDPETGLSHLAHASCCLMFLLEYEVTHKELDDRYKSESK